MICSKCNKEISDDSVFCTQCGNKIEIIISENNIEDNKNICSYCKAPLGINEKFCVKCGKEVGKEDRKSSDSESWLNIITYMPAFIIFIIFLPLGMPWWVCGIISLALILIIGFVIKKIIKKK